MSVPHKDLSALRFGDEPVRKVAVASTTAVTVISVVGRGAAALAAGLTEYIQGEH